MAMVLDAVVGKLVEELMSSVVDMKNKALKFKSTLQSLIREKQGEWVSEEMVQGVPIKPYHPPTDKCLIREKLNVGVFRKSIGVKFTHKLGVEVCDWV